MKFCNKVWIYYRRDPRERLQSQNSFRVTHEAAVVASRRQQRPLVIVFEACYWYPNHEEMSSRPRRKIAFAQRSCERIEVLHSDRAIARSRAYVARNITYAGAHDLKQARRNSPRTSPVLTYKTICCAHTLSFLPFAQPEQRSPFCAEPREKNPRVPPPRCAVELRKKNPHASGVNTHSSENRLLKKCAESK